jgi:hypothetical protein
MTVVPRRAGKPAAFASPQACLSVTTTSQNGALPPVIGLKETGSVKRGAAEPSHCAHGEWTFAGADYKRQANQVALPNRRV